MPLRTTHTYAILEVSSAVYNEINAKLRAAGYHHAFHEDSQHGTVIDLHGIALALENEPQVATAAPMPGCAIHGHDYHRVPGTEYGLVCIICGRENQVP